jgi:hypothetical protein
MPPDTGISWGTLLAFGLPVLGALSAGVITLIRWLLGSEKRARQAEQANTNEKVVKLERLVEMQQQAFDKLRDKWDEFLCEYLKIDSTRGQKIDALFRGVDEMREGIREIRVGLNSKIEDSYSRALSELKLYVRDIKREERNG